MKYYHASSPDALLDYMDEKENKIKFQKIQITKLLPQLKLMQKLKENKKEAQLFMGWKGIMNAFNSILEGIPDGKDYTAFTQTSLEEQSKQVKLFFSQYQRKRETKRLKTKLIANKSDKAVFQNDPYTNFKNFEARYIDNSPPGIIITDNNVLISTFDPEPVGVLISSKEIASSFRNYFYNEWKKSEK